MNLARRVILSLGLAAALAAVAAIWCSSLTGRAESGWFMYSPNSTSDVYTVGGAGDDYVWQRGAIWLTAIALWTVVSWRLFRSDRE